jgi:hypothetical protein
MSLEIAIMVDPLLEVVTGQNRYVSTMAYTWAMAGSSRRTRRPSRLET